MNLKMNRSGDLKKSGWSSCWWHTQAGRACEDGDLAGWGRTGSDGMDKAAEPGKGQVTEGQLSDTAMRKTAHRPQGSPTRHSPEEGR